MIEEQFIRYIINDLITSEEYTLPGIAYYTNTPEEVIYDLASGANNNPSLRLSRKIVELHQSTRPELYTHLIKKITEPSLD